MSDILQFVIYIGAISRNLRKKEHLRGGRNKKVNEKIMFYWANKTKTNK